MGPTRHDPLDGLDGERFSGTAPTVNAQMAADLDPVPGAGALRIRGQRQPCKPSALGDILDNGTRNIFGCREAAENRERLEQTQETQTRLTGTAGVAPFCMILLSRPNRPLWRAFIPAWLKSREKSSPPLARIKYIANAAAKVSRTGWEQSMTGTSCPLADGQGGWAGVYAGGGRRRHGPSLGTHGRG
jgi:hypothetical protein